MYWVTLSAFMLCVGALVLDWRRIREALPAGLVGIVLSGLQLVADADRTPLLLVIKDQWDRVSITLLQQTIVAPVIGIWFAQGLGGDRTYPVFRILKFMAMSLSMEAMAVVAGQILYAPTWNMGLSAVYYLGWYSTVWWIQTRLSVRTNAQTKTEAPPG